ncbi:MAG: thioredoxin family protein [Chitinophagaceae bacterium]|nr:thioredoxin family protein [Chitinophagaceae bacterium]
MKNFIIVFIVLFFSSCISTQKINYSTTQNGNEKILTGVINRDIIESDTSFPWFANNYKYAQPSATAVASIKSHSSKIKIIAFGGTWCEDTQNLLPMFYKLIDKSEFPLKQLTLVGVDRAKKSGADGLTTKYNILNVPTFIVLNKKGEEIGRVVEYGKYNEIDRELGEIVEKAK